jgi:hypothetical protein
LVRSLTENFPIVGTLAFEKEGGDERATFLSRR